MASASGSKEYKLAVKIAGSISSSFNSAIGDAGNKLTELGNIAQKAAAVAAAAWGALKVGEFVSNAVDTYKSFDQSMANTAATAGATAEEYAAMRQAALAMGRATSKTAAESADALGYMALAGWSVEDSIASLEPILRLSEATQMDLARCSDLVTDSMSAAGLAVSDLSMYLDVAAQANNKSNQTAEQLMEAYIGVGGTLKGLNVPIQESAAALGVMANRGIKGGEAGNALNAVLVNLTTGTGQAGKMMEKLGISAFDSSGKFIGLQETIQKVYGATKDMTDAERNAALAAIGGKQHADALNALMAGLTTTTADGVTEWNALADSLYNSKGAMAAMAATVTDTWEGAKAKLDSAIEDLQINLVDTFAPYAKDAINAVAEAIPNITAAVTPVVQGFMDYALPRIQSFVSGAIQCFNDIQPTLEAIGTTAMEIFGFIGTTVRGAMTAIGQTFSEHQDILNTVGRIGQQAGQIIMDAFEAAKPVLTFIGETALPAIVDAALSVIGFGADMISTILEFKEIVIVAAAAFAAFKAGMALQSVIQGFRQAKVDLLVFTATTEGADLAQKALNGTMTVWQTIVGVLTGKIKLTQLAVAAWTKAQTALQAVIAANPIAIAVAAIAALIAIVVVLYNKCEWFRNGVNSIIEAVKGYFQGFLEKAQQVFNAIWPIVRDIGAKIGAIAQSVWYAVSGVATAVIGFFQSYIMPGIQAAMDLICGIFSAAWSVIQAIWSVVSPWFAAIWSAIKAVFSVAGSVLGGFFQLAWGNIKGIWDTAKAYFQAVFDTITGIFTVIGAVFRGDFSGAWEAVKSVFSSWGNYFQTLWDNIRGGVTRLLQVLDNLTGGAISNILGFFSGLWDNIKGIWSKAASWFQTTVITPLVNFFSPIIETISGIFRGCWIIIQAIWKAVSMWFQSNVITPLVTLFSTIVSTVSGFFSSLWTAIQNIWNAVSGWFQATVITPTIGFFSAIPGAIGGFFSALWANIQAIWAAVSGWFQTTVITPLVNFFAPIVESIGGFFSTLWTNIQTVWQAAGTWFMDNVATPINNAFQAVSDFVRGIFNGLLGFVENLINGVVGGINKFIGGFSGVVEKAASFIGVDWGGISELPTVSLPRMAKGGIVDNPTILEAGEAGTEAIVPLSQLWSQMQGMFDNSIGSLSDQIASLAERLDAAEIGSNAMPLSDLLGKFADPDDGSDDDDEPPITIYYQPEYHFDGGAPDKEEMVKAGRISQDEFDQHMAQYLKGRRRKDL